MTTFYEEVKLIWHRRRSWFTLLFVANRYAVLVYGILAIASSYVDVREVSSIFSTNLITVRSLLTISSISEVSQFTCLCIKY